MRIAIDIDSTLHHYWDVLSDVSRRRFGIELPYEEQLTWGMTRLRPDQFALCVQESHSDERILAGTPYPGAVEAVKRWHDREGHFIHVTSQRDCDRKAATAQWLARIGLPYDDLHCSRDKLARCRELQIELWIDDGPLNLEAALEHGIAAATLLHPWNRDFCEVENVLGARDWPELELMLEPLLARQGTEVAAAK
jgi:hypothetical protein